METSARVFGKLRSLAVLLESQTAQLHRAHKDPEYEGSEGSVNVLHELRTEIKDLKVEIRDQLARCRVEDGETRALVQACMVLKQRTTEDLQLLKRHFEKYGYRPQSEMKGHEEDRQSQKPQKKEDGEKEEQEVEPEKKPNVAVDREDGEAPVCVTPAKPPLWAADPLRTPRLSDFGLSGFQLLTSLGEPAPPPVEFVPPAAKPAVPSVLPKVPKTPKCALRMDEDAPTPRLEDFGISEHTMCLNNDFTMDLLRKKPSKLCSKVTVSTDLDLEPDPKSDRCLFTPMPASGTSEVDDYVTSPQPPALCTPGLKVAKKQACLFTPPPPDSFSLPDLRLTPEPPVFETPYMRKLISVRASAGCSQMDAPGKLGVDAAASQDEKTHPTEHVSSNQGLMSQDDTPSMPVRTLREDEHTPKMPTLESFLSTDSQWVDEAGVKLLVTSEGSGASFGLKEPLLSGLGAYQELQGQERNLLSPPTQSSLLPCPMTPDMPNVCSFTQDIFKLISQDNTTPNTVIPSNPKTTALRSTMAGGKENRLQPLTLVSEEEFLRLPGYLRQMPLSSLNQAIGKINAALEGSQSGSSMEPGHFLVDDLKRITGAGLKAHVYFLCLTELERLEQIQGEGSSSVYRVFSQT